MENEKLIALLEKYTLGTLTPDEQADLETWYANYSADRQLNPDPKIMRKRLKQIATNLPLQRKASRIRRLRPYLSGAAILMIGFGLFFLRNSQEDSSVSPTAIQPGYNQASLTLANGRTINLDSAQHEIIIGDEGIVYNNGKKVEGTGPAETFGQTDSIQAALHTQHAVLATPKGGQYRITLSDGTKVMLNASSTLRYPSRFSGNTRTVEITGEGFFEVAPIKDKPFTVKSKNLEIDVIGTSFNVSAYPDESSERTTLVTGNVKVRAVDLKRKTYNVQHLAPGKQATIRGNRLTVSTIDADNEIAWTQGYFAFDKNTLEEVLKQLSRWYGIDGVSYKEAALRQELFSGTINRYDQITEVLHKLSLTGTVAFRMEGRTIQVTRGSSPP